jgi:hypothetical protein
MIKVRVIDETDSATFVIFDRDAALLLKKTAADMIESMGVNYIHYSNIKTLVCFLFAYLYFNYMYHIFFYILCNCCLYDQSDESETLPKEISSLVESTFLFKVETNISTDARFEKSYRVRRISNDVELLKKFTGVPTVCALLWLKLFIISFHLHYCFFFFLMVSLS